MMAGSGSGSDLRCGSGSGRPHASELEELHEAEGCAARLLRLCCDLSAVWLPHFEAAFSMWRLQPPPKRSCSPAQADHRFPPFVEWREIASPQGGEEPHASPQYRAAMWTQADSLRTLALRYLMTQLLPLQAMPPPTAPPR